MKKNKRTRYETEFYSNEERAKALKYVEENWKNESLASQARHVSDFVLLIRTSKSETFLDTVLLIRTVLLTRTVF